VQPAAARRGEPEGLLAGLETGVFQVYSSDHCPFRYDDPAGQAHPKGRTSFRWVPNGIPGVETRLPILFSEGVVKGRISLDAVRGAHRHQPRQDVRPAPAEGHDRGRRRRRHRHLGPERKVTISQTLLHHGSDYTPYEGLEVTGGR
jgi:dihydropyrimidinase